jgi:hypothetical protein
MFLGVQIRGEKNKLLGSPVGNAGGVASFTPTDRIAMYKRSITV